MDKDLSKEQAQELFGFLQVYQVDLLAEVEHEIQSWVAEFQSNLLQLDKIKLRTRGYYQKINLESVVHTILIRGKNVK